MTRRILLLGAFALVVAACGSNKPVSRGVGASGWIRGTLQIGVTGALHTGDRFFLEGVTIAVDEINSAGGVLGKKIEIIPKDNQNNLNTAKKIAREFADNRNIVAVLCNSSSDIALPTSIIYEYNNLLAIFTQSTSPFLTSHGFKLIFRMIANDIEVGREMVRHLRRIESRDKTNIMILFETSTYGRSLANGFQVALADDTQLNVVETYSYNGWDRDFRNLLLRMKDIRFDAILLSGSEPPASTIIRVAREMGITQPIFGGDGLDDNGIWKNAGKASDGLLVGSLYDEKDSRPTVAKFQQSYEERYKQKPDAWAAQGYDAVHLLADAITAVGSSSPDTVAYYLHYLKGWQGVTGTHSFDPAGEVADKKVIFKVLYDGKYHPLDQRKEQPARRGGA